MLEKILNARQSPKELELLFQQDPDQFSKTFSDAHAQYPDSIIFQVWDERLGYWIKNRQQTATWSYKHIFLVILIAFLAGTIAKLPLYILQIGADWFYSRNLVGIILISLIVYFLFGVPHSKKMMGVILGVTLLALLYLNLLPNQYYPSFYQFAEKHRAFSDALILAETHMPILFWSLLGLAFLGKAWKSTSGRMNFLRYNGELVIYAIILIIGGAVLTGITMALFDFIRVPYDIIQWYIEYVVVYGAVAIPIVASFLIVKIIGKKFNMAPILAKIFTPLFLLTTIAYLVIMFIYRNNLNHINRDNLLTLNILLFFVLAILIFSISERNPETPIGLNDYFNFGLVLATLILNSIAFSVVIFRISSLSYGLTPNRIAILGINVLIFIHLLGILIHYLRFILRKNTLENLENWITGYLPVYVVWAVFISIALPIIFWAKP
jgi:hypothetical protein